jgi:hypothetical protein
MIRQNLILSRGYRKYPYPPHKTVPFEAKKCWRKENVILRKEVSVIEQLLCSKQLENVEDLYVPKKCLENNKKNITKKNVHIPGNIDIIKFICNGTSPLTERQD